MMDLDQIVESFKLNIDRIVSERLAEIIGLLDAVPRATMNETLDKIGREPYPDKPAFETAEFHAGKDWAIQRMRDEVQKTV